MMLAVMLADEPGVTWPLPPTALSLRPDVLPPVCAPLPASVRVGSLHGRFAQ